MPLWVYGGSYSQDFSSFTGGQVNLGGGLTLTSSVPSYANAHVEDATLKELQLSQWDIKVRAIAKRGFRTERVNPSLD